MAKAAGSGTVADMKPMTVPMPQVDDLSRSLQAFEQTKALVAVLEMSQSSWLVAGVVPGVERRPLKKLDPDPATLLRLVDRWRDHAVKAGHAIMRVVLAVAVTKSIVAAAPIVTQYSARQLHYDRPPVRRCRRGNVRGFLGNDRRCERWAACGYSALLTPLVNQTRRYLEPAGNFGDRRTRRKCRGQNRLALLVTPAAMTFWSRQKCNLTHAAQLRVPKETSLRAQLPDHIDVTQDGLRRRVTPLQPLGGDLRHRLLRVVGALPTVEA